MDGALSSFECVLWYQHLCNMCLTCWRDACPDEDQLELSQDWKAVANESISHTIRSRATDSLLKRTMILSIRSLHINRYRYHCTTAQVSKIESSLRRISKDSCQTPSSREFVYILHSKHIFAARLTSLIYYVCIRSYLHLPCTSSLD